MYLTVCSGPCVSDGLCSGPCVSDGLCCGPCVSDGLCGGSCVSKFSDGLGAFGAVLLAW